MHIRDDSSYSSDVVTLCTRTKVSVGVSLVFWNEDDDVAFLHFLFVREMKWISSVKYHLSDIFCSVRPVETISQDKPKNEPFPEMRTLKTKATTLLFIPGG